MRKLLLTITAVIAISANAQDYSKMSRYVRQLVNNYEVNKEATQAKGISPTLSSENSEIIAFVKAPEEVVSEYCLAHRKDIHIVKIPLSEVITLSEDSRVERIETSENNTTADLDSLASCVNIAPLWEGQTPIPQAFTGSGTLIGMVDIGIEYVHPTFRSKSDDHLRIVRAWDMLDFSGGNSYNSKAKFPIGRLYTNTDDIEAKKYTADSKTEWHGTHTSGIAAGSGYDTKYSGMAPDADIYAVGCIISSNYSYLPSSITSLNTSTLNTLAFERIFEYADSINRPAVINYSISGLQDMTEDDALLNEYLSDITSEPGHIIVSSIGNSGQKKRYLPKTSDDTTVGGKIGNSSEKLFVINISTQSKLTLRITDYKKNLSKDISLDFLPGNKKKTSSSGLKWKDYSINSNIKDLDSLDIYVYSGPDGFDDSKVGYDIFLYQNKYTFSSINYGIEIIGDNAPAEIFVQNGELISGTTYSSTLTGALQEGNCGSPGALPSVIGVGNTAHWGLGGKRYYMSSIGPSLHGYTKPDIMAPGYKIWSAYNSVYQANNGNITTAKNSTYNGKTYSWIYQHGTSMASPAVAGIIALWLEADPTLTKDRIMDVFAHTSTQPDATLSYPNNMYGYGEINAYRGLLYILGIDGIEGLSSEHISKASVRPDGNGNITVTLDGENTKPLNCRLYTTGGALAKSITLPPYSTTHTIPADGLKGIIAVQIDGMGSTLVRVN